MKFFKNTADLDGTLEGMSGRKVWLNHMRSRKFVYTLGILSILATDITEVLIPKFLQWNIDALQKGQLHSTPFVWGLVGFLLLQFAGRILWRQCLGQQTHKAACQMKSLLWDRARFLPEKKLNGEFSPGELMNMATADVGTARLAYGFTLVGTVDFIFLMLFTLTAMFFIHWKLTLLTLAVVPVLPFILDRLSRTENLRHHEAQQALTHLSEEAAQSVATIRLQKITQSSDFWRRRLETSAQNYQKKRYQVVLTTLNFIPVTGLAPLISYAVLMIYGMKLLFSGSLSLGAFVAMQSYIFLVQSPLLELGTIVSEWQRSFASMDRLQKLFRAPEAHGLRLGGEKLDIIQSPVFDLRHVSFGFEPESRKILNDFSMTIPKGARIGIQGPVGSGKSTFLRLLGGMETGYSGEILLSGMKIENYSHKSLTTHLSYVPQKSFLFADTIRANLDMNRSYTDEEIWTALDFAAVKKDVETLPNKLHTRLGEWGVNLSGGQKQRLTLARALLRRPEILLLDDCLSAVDTVTEEKILASLNTFLKSTTVIWVAHRESTLRHCDQIIDFGGSA